MFLLLASDKQTKVGHVHPPRLFPGVPVRPIHLEDDLGTGVELLHGINKRDDLILKLVEIPVTDPIPLVSERLKPRRAHQRSPAKATAELVHPR